MSVLGVTKPSDVEPNADYGLFGPDSIAWRVWSYPTSLTIGVYRASFVEFLDPLLMAGFEQKSSVRYRSRNRYERTIRYFALVAFGDSRSVLKASDALVKVHLKVAGDDPVTGQRFDANSASQQLWVLLTGWHSVLYAYEKFGPGPLSEAEDEQYWRECAVAAEVAMCDPDDVPTSREGVREYFAQVRPHLAVSESTQRMLRFFHQESVLPEGSAVLEPAKKLADMAFKTVGLSTVPRYIRDMTGVHPRPGVPFVAGTALRVTFALIDRSPRLKLMSLQALVPSTVPFMAPMVLGVEPTDPTTLTPAEARAKFDVPTPPESYARIRRRRVSRDEVAAAEALIGPTAVDPDGRRAWVRG